MTRKKKSNEMKCDILHYGTANLSRGFLHFAL